MSIDNCIETAVSNVLKNPILTILHKVNISNFTDIDKYSKSPSKFQKKYRIKNSKKIACKLN